MKKILGIGRANDAVRVQQFNGSEPATALICNIQELPLHINGYDVAFIDGAMADDHNMMLSLLQTVDAQGMEIALNMAARDVVMQQRDFFRQILTDYVDIVFAHEDEAMAYAFGGGDVTGMTQPALMAATFLGRTCRVAVVRLADGGVVYHDDAREGLCPADCARTEIEHILGTEVPDEVWF